MKRFFLIFTLICSMANVSIAQDITGYWKGTLNLGPTELELCFDIKEADGVLSATLDVPAQGAYDIPVTSISYEMMKLTMEIAPLSATFEGTFVLNNITGEFTQMGMSLPLTLIKGEKEAKPKRPQEPQPPFPYKSEDVYFKNTREDFTLAGTLTIPEGDGPFPAMILISGSGPQNRDEELSNHRPFAVIADYLSRNGVAVLRYDDRGVASSEAGKSDGTSFDISYDAEAAFDYLLSRKEVIPSLCGITGHSEGGYINFMIAQRRPDVAFLISLAGPAVTGAEVLKLQQAEIYRGMGMPEPMVEQNRVVSEKLFAIVDKYDTPDENFRKEALGYLASVGMPDDVAVPMIDQYGSPWMFYFLKYDPAPAIREVTIPALILNGTMDKQVVSSQSLPVFRQIAEERGRDNMKIVELEGLNHLFQHAKTGLPTEYGTIEETISEEVLKLMLDFVNSIK
ncbi:MAG: alpha/beta hydrolase [Bacteroidales bacterium]|nr:alpha/beta hydrolase [Bacteroidales bacterium]